MRWTWRFFFLIFIESCQLDHSGRPEESKLALLFTLVSVRSTQCLVPGRYSVDVEWTDK